MRPDLMARGLVEGLKKANADYRAGDPWLSDSEYDAKLKHLIEIDPDNPYLKSIEPERAFNSKGEVKHSVPMLSTDKAYPLPAGEEGKSDLEKWIARCEKASTEAWSEEEKQPGWLLYRVTAKLDGVAARLYVDGDRKTLTTRGDGSKGSDITHVLNAGLVVKGEIESPNVDGELVMPWDYFKGHLAEEFSYPRNVLAGLCGSIDYSLPQQEMLDQKQAHLVLYKDLDDVLLTGPELLSSISKYAETFKHQCPYLIDGLIIEVMDQKTKELMGSTDHHHRWMLAYKETGAAMQTTVQSITWQAGRTGIITPVLEIDELLMPGAWVKRVSGHNVDYLEINNIGPGAKIEVIRAGEVIPKHVRTVKPGKLEIPLICPECESALRRVGPSLKCDDYMCPGKVRSRIEHFFTTMNNCDGFGPSVVKKLVAKDIRDVGEVFDLTTSDSFQDLGFGPGTSSNLADELERCRTEEVEDWRLLAAIGIEGLGTGDSKKLLRHHSLQSILRKIPTEEEVILIPGFAEVKARKVVAGLEREKELIDYLFMAVKFNLAPTFLARDMDDESLPLRGKSFCFTGKMTERRATMEALAEEKGGTVQSGVSSKTNYLVYGGKLGATKKQAAEKHGTELLTEDDFRGMIDE